MTAVDKTFTTGRVGVGSFDDKGQFDHIAVYGLEAKQAKVGKVQGTVTLQGKPLAGATITFTPEKGRPATGVTDEEGNYLLSTFKANDGAALGRYPVSISLKDKNQAELIPEKYNTRTELVREIKQGENVFDFELKD